MNAGVAQG